jgi:ABC-type antimicrobial peptide transport system permease subunit
VSRSSVGRQISLPLRRAAAIAYQNVRARLGRSLLIAAGIVLAVAFLVSVQTSATVVNGLRNWIAQLESGESHATATRLESQQLREKLRSHGVVGAQRLRTRWVLGLALLVAFVGILNAMLMSVTERFREIGTMKCLGALDGFIVKLFLIESLYLGAIGTIAGIALGLGMSLVSATAGYGVHALRHLSLGPVMVTILTSLTVGIGLSAAGAAYPAWQAARMQPVEAMRVEA